MSSLSQDESLELTVFGYVRRLEKLFSSHRRFIPNVVKVLIFEYARNFFSWYTKKQGIGYRLFDNKALEAEKTSGGYSFLASANCLSADIYDKFEWEITIIDSKVKENVDIALMIGFVEYPIEDSIHEWDTFFNTNKQFGVHLFSTHTYLTKYGRTGGSFAEQDESYIIQNGDRFWFRFDFGKRKCSFGFNHMLFEDIFVNIPAKIIPTVCMYDPMIFACTKWNEIKD